ncbi:hypothetical protein LOK49_LG05G01758 [Camellia lanceoleosa]|uniref:Uncharacterized protein n=1 Tax=Camellia lanceoleosa TaxID=1840588 RepID=A0ACC0HGN3_9ERIC|nr:hypothetical protein LOK49_LG05G01758 [Camellia lanceoleosa]
MGTEVLHPQDCLIERIKIAQPVFQHHRQKNNGNPNPSRKPAVRPEQKKNKPLASSRSASLDDLRKRHNHNNYHHNNLVMGQVMILRNVIVRICFCAVVEWVWIGGEFFRER